MDSGIAQVDHIQLWLAVVIDFLDIVGCGKFLVMLVVAVNLQTSKFVHGFQYPITQLDIHKFALSLLFVVTLVGTNISVLAEVERFQFRKFKEVEQIANVPVEIECLNVVRPFLRNNLVVAKLAFQFVLELRVKSDVGFERYRVVDNKVFTSLQISVAIELYGFCAVNVRNVEVQCAYNLRCQVKLHFLSRTLLGVGDVGLI